MRAKVIYWAVATATVLAMFTGWVAFRVHTSGEPPPSFHMAFMLLLSFILCGMWYRRHGPSLKKFFVGERGRLGRLLDRRKARRAKD